MGKHLDRGSHTVSAVALVIGSILALAVTLTVAIAFNLPLVDDASGGPVAPDRVAGR
jgi:uncharacterized membrane protein